MTPDFFIVDQGDGWTRNDSPIACFILDGPGPTASLRNNFWLVRTEPTLRWDGDARYAERWGPDHDLAHPMTPTDRALVMAAAPNMELKRDWSIPTYPVAPDTTSLTKAHPILSGYKVKIELTVPRL